MNRLALLLLLGATAIGGGTVLAMTQRSQVSAQSLPKSQVARSSALVALSPASTAPAYPTLKISNCHGSPAHANFRQFPSFAPGSILGVVAIGEAIHLTGRTARVEGEWWHEAINLAPLHPTPDIGAQNRDLPNQVGWVARCFVSSLVNGDYHV